MRTVRQGKVLWSGTLCRSMPGFELLFDECQPGDVRQQDFDPKPTFNQAIITEPCDMEG